MTDPGDFYEHDMDIADSFASKALEKMRAEEIPPVPQNFELWYIYYSNVNAKLRDGVNELLSTQGKLTPDDCKDLYARYLNFGNDREHYEKAGSQINATLHDVTTILQSVKNTTGEFTGVLQETSGKLDIAQAPEDVQALLNFITQETKRMVAYNEELEGRLDQSYNVMSDLKRDMDRIRREAITDGLTGLANRKAFDEQLERLANDSRKEGNIFSLIMVDIDHFKSFNDTYGHQVGDQVLRLVAMTLVNEVKGQDMAARYGGEEFAIILPGTNVNAARIVAENLRKAVEKKEVVNRASGENLGQITISLGVAQFYTEETTEELVSRADKALYISKNKGRNTVSQAKTPHEMD